MRFPFQTISPRLLRVYIHKSSLASDQNWQQNQETAARIRVRNGLFIVKSSSPRVMVVTFQIDHFKPENRLHFGFECEQLSRAIKISPEAHRCNAAIRC